MESAYQTSTYVWAITHILGALVMLYAWRRYHQEFFGWSSAKWLLQAAAGITRDVLPPNLRIPVLLVLRYGVAITGCVALYYTLLMVHRRFAHVVGITDSSIILRDGLRNVEVQVERITERPPLPPRVPSFDEDQSS